MTKDLNLISDKNYWETQYPNTNNCNEILPQITSINNSMNLLTIEDQKIKEQITNLPKPTGFGFSVNASNPAKVRLEIDRGKIRNGLNHLKELSNNKQKLLSENCQTNTVTTSINNPLSTNTQNNQTTATNATNATPNINSNLTPSDVPKKEVAVLGLKTNKNNLILGGIGLVILLGGIVFYIKSNK